MESLLRGFAPPDRRQQGVQELELVSFTGSASSSRSGPPQPPHRDTAAIWIQQVIEELGLQAEISHIKSQGQMWRVAQVQPQLFDSIRRLSGLEEAYLGDLCAEPLEAAPSWVGRRPSWATSSGAFLLQPLQPCEAAYLEAIAHRYKEHLEENPDSLLSRIVGLYDVGRQLPGGGSHVAVSRNFLPRGTRPPDYLYSLRGTAKDRFVQRTGVAAQLLHDANFVEEQQVIVVPRPIQQKLCQAIQADASFLQQLHAVGYALMLGIRKVSEESKAGSFSVSRWSSSGQVPEDGHHGWRPNQEPVVFYLGIVDVLQQFSRVQHLVGKVTRAFTQEPVLEPPRKYSQRFAGFLEDHILPVDDQSEVLSVQSEHLNRRPSRSGRRPPPSALSVVAAAELEDADGPASLEDLARWRALLDILEAGPEASQPWRSLNLVKAGVEGLVPSFREDVARRPPLPFVGTADQADHRPTGIALAKIGKLLKSVDQVRAMQEMGGGTVSETSRQYSLALAIAVGVEAATQCSARIAERSKELFSKYPELAERPAAVQAERTLLLPEEGSWLSPPHMLPDLQFVEHAPEVFREVRSARGVDDKAYIDCVCQRDFSFIEFTTNSKSGEFFFFTHDARCMVKTISIEEARSLLGLLKNGYLQHVRAAEGSLLTRIFGLYQVHLPWFNAGRPQHFMVQENVLFGGGRFTERFDLKGSTFGRDSRPGELIQKDNNWVAKGHSFDFPRTARDRIQRQHRRDCSFLASCGVLDYSLLVGVCERRQSQVEGLCRSASENACKRPDDLGKMSMILTNSHKPAELWERLRKEVVASSPYGPHEANYGQVFFLGIIDFLVTWSCRKQLEYGVKVLCCKGAQASVNPPWRYARRQIDFLAEAL